MKRFIFFAMLIIPLAGCDFSQRERALKEHELTLTRREEALLQKEQGLKLKEEELMQLAQELDSSLHDTALVHNPALIGRWNVKMTCTETSCHGSAVGDTKSEVWDIYYSRFSIVAKAINANQVTRVYTGRLSNNLLELTDEVPVSPSTPATQVIIRLTPSDKGTMEGQREIVRTGDCKILYELQLKKQ